MAVKFKIKLCQTLLSPSLPLDNFQPGVRYNFFLYRCSSEAPELLQHWQGYMQELGKDSTACGKLSSDFRNHTLHFNW